MKLTEALLLKYVDGELSADDIKQVEDLLAGDALARENVSHMRVSGEALLNMEITPEEQEAADAMKARLSLGELLMLPPAANDLGQLDSDENARRAAKQSSRGWWNFGSIAAALVIMFGGMFAGFNMGVATLSAEDIAMSKLPVWVARVVDYHTLYDRETVAGDTLNSAKIEQLEASFGAVLNQSLIFPDLRGINLELKRGQILKLEGQEIIQLAYLPNVEGKPVALCFRAVEGADSLPEYSNLRGLEVAQWRQNGIEYLLLGEQSRSEIVATAEKAMAEIVAG